MAVWNSVQPSSKYFNRNRREKPKTFWKTEIFDHTIKSIIKGKIMSMVARRSKCNPGKIPNFVKKNVWISIFHTT